jgi:hypothetical protein
MSALKHSYLVVWLSRTTTDELYSAELLALFAIPAMLLVPRIANWLVPYWPFSPLMISVCYSIYSLSLWFNCRSWSQPYCVCSNWIFMAYNYSESCPTSLNSFPRSRFRFNRQIRALFLFLKSRYSSEGKYRRIDISCYLLICSMLIRKFPIYTQSFPSFSSFIFALSASPLLLKGAYLTPYGRFARNYGV